ncbi:NAD(P)/FAD-dependent oxidoreductase [soil metagenome]
MVVGGGFAGASLVEHLPPALRRPGATLLIDRSEEYSFIPLIHELAVGRIHPNSIRFPLSSICKGRCDFLMAEVLSIHPGRRTLETSNGAIGYEYLVLAAGSGAARPPEEVRQYFQLFWTPENALTLRTNLNQAWNAALDQVAGYEPGLLNVAIVGGGATGVELAAEIAVLFRYLKRRSPRSVRAEPRITLFEAEDRLLGWLDPYFHRVAISELEKLGVEVKLNTVVETANAKGIVAGDEYYPARTRVWTTGIEAAPMVGALPGHHDSIGRVSVAAHLTLRDHPDVYVLGDSGLYVDPRHGVLPPTASVAVQQGPWAARDLARRLSNAARPPFDFFDRGYVVSLGPDSAVAKAVGARVRGRAAQALYRSIFLYYLRSRRDRILTTSDWAMERTLGRIGFGNQPKGSS